MAVLVAHRYPAVSAGLAAAVRTRLGQPEVLRPDSVDACVDLARLHRPQAAIVDMELVPGGELALCEKLYCYDVATLAVTRGNAVDALSLLEAGAQGIALATDGLDELLLAFRSVLKGQAYVPNHLLGTVLQGLILQRRAKVATENKVARLSPREREVLGLLRAGADHRDIASRLSISPHTAKTHIQRLLAKLEVRSRAEAVALAVTHGVDATALEVVHG